MSLDYYEARRLMYLIRRVEEEIETRYPKGLMRCPVHLSFGQEASAVGVCSQLELDDWVFSNHRCHAHYLAKGGDLFAMIAELHGKAEGCTGGVGGSMRLSDPKCGFMGASAIVGSSLSVAVGAAMAAKHLNNGRRVVAFIGDGVAETGQFWEAISYVALHLPPLLIVCENNGLATNIPLAHRQPPGPLHLMVHTMGVHAMRIGRPQSPGDLAVISTCASVVLSKLPIFLEIGIQRLCPHVGMRAEGVGYGNPALDPVLSLPIEEPMKREVGELVVRTFDEVEALPDPPPLMKPMMEYRTSDCISWGASPSG